MVSGHGVFNLDLWENIWRFPEMGGPPNHGGCMMKHGIYTSLGPLGGCLLLVGWDSFGF